MILIRHTLLCVFVLLVIITGAFLLVNLGTILGGQLLGILFFCLLVLLYLALIILFFISKKYSLLALPLSHMILPVIVYIISYCIFTISPAEYSFNLLMSVFFGTVYYFLPATIILFIISFALAVKRKKIPPS